MKTLRLRSLRQGEAYVRSVYRLLDDSRSQTKPRTFPGSVRSLDKNVKSRLWAKDLDTALATVRYILALGIKCYLLAVVDGKPHSFARIDASTPDATLRKALVGRMNRTLRWPVRLRGKLYDEQALIKGTDWEFIQCRVTPRKERGGDPVPWEYKELVKACSDQYELPNGLYVLTLTDAQIFRRDRSDPFLLGRDLPVPKTSLPILNGSGHVDYFDIAIPNYDDLYVAFEHDSITNVTLDWASKKPVAVWRGSSTGCGYTRDSNPRLKLAAMANEMLDVGVVSLGQSLKLDPKQGLGYHSDSLRTVAFKSVQEQSTYKYILQVDGNVAAFRLAKMMLLGSVILLVDGPFTLWYDSGLKAYEHYVPVKADLSDLASQIEWCRKNDDKCAAIATKARLLASRLLTKRAVVASFAKTLWSI